MTTLPEALRPFAAGIEATRKPILAASFTEKRVLSQLGGTPWWPASIPYPTNAEGKPLFLLVQIDFRETPPLAPFPREGMLQIFIDGADGVYGADFDDPRASPGVAYHFHSDLTQAAALEQKDFSNIAYNWDCM